MAITRRPVGPVTDEEFVELAERNPGYQFERTVRGELIVALDSELRGFAAGLLTIRRGHRLEFLALVELEGIEPSTSSTPKRRSPAELQPHAPCPVQQPVLYRTGARRSIRPPAASTGCRACVARGAWQTKRYRSMTWASPHRRSRL